VVTADDGAPLLVVEDADWAESAERLDAFMAEHDRIVAENERLREALERIAKEPAPGSTISCRNIAKAALSGSSQQAASGSSAEVQGQGRGSAQRDPRTGRAMIWGTDKETT
jgi:hypothetical protein